MAQQFTFTKLDRLVHSAVWQHPGSGGLALHEHVVRLWADGSARWLRWAWLFGPSLGGVYVSLLRLELMGAIEAVEGEATAERGGRRPLLWRVVS